MATYCGYSPLHLPLLRPTPYQSVGHVTSFDSIRTEAAAVMQRLSLRLASQLEEPSLSPDVLGSNTRLLLLMEGDDEGSAARRLAPAACHPLPAAY